MSGVKEPKSNPPRNIGVLKARPGDRTVETDLLCRLVLVGKFFIFMFRTLGLYVEEHPGLFGVLIEKLRLFFFACLRVCVV